MAARRGKKRPKPASAQPDPPGPDDLMPRLEKVALGYLNRFDSSVANLRTILKRRVRSWVKEQEETDAVHFQAQALAAIETLLERYQESGLLDDTRFVDVYSQQQRDRGRSTRAILFRLQQKGIDPEVARATLEQDTDPLTELRAALRLLKRRRGGPYRAERDRSCYRDKDLAALARAGFSSDVALRALEVDPEALDN